MPTKTKEKTVRRIAEAGIVMLRDCHVVGAKREDHPHARNGLYVKGQTIANPTPAEYEFVGLGWAKRLGGK